MPKTDLKALYARGLKREEEEMERRGGCEVCRRKGPKHHFNWAHKIPLRRGTLTTTALELRRLRTNMNQRTWERACSQVRLLCLICHANETVEQRNNNWLPPTDVHPAHSE